MGRRNLILVDRNSIHAFRIISEDLVDSVEAQRVLGLSKGPFFDLVNRGLVPAFRGPKIDGSSSWQFRKNVLVQFLDSVFARVADEPDDGPECTFNEALRKISWHQLKAADLVQEVLSGALSVQRLDPTQCGLAQCVFVVENIVGLIGRQHGRNTDRVTITEAARKLGLNQEAVYDLVERRLLHTVSDVYQGRDFRMVPVSAIDVFKASYVAAADIADDLQTSPRHFVETAISVGVRPITGPGIDGGRQYFFLKSQIEAPGVLHRIEAALAERPVSTKPYYRTPGEFSAVQI